MTQPYFIVFANEKGGTGKSTTAVHTAIALAASGHRVGALDLDSRQRTMTRYLENRDATRSCRGPPTKCSRSRARKP
jgi:chromosome partitioning protein